MADGEAKLRISAENRTRAAFNEIKRSMSDVQKSSLSLRSALAGTGAGLSIVGITAFVKSAINAQDELGKLSQRVGVSVESLSALKYAGDLADVSLEQLGTGLRMLSKNMTDMQAGTGEAQDAFKALGISVEASKGSLKTSEAVLFEIADQFASMEDGAGKTALAMRLFGRAGADLIPLLNQGAKGLRESAEEAKRFGLIISTDAARAAEKFNDDLTRLSAGAKAFGIGLANDALPWLNKMIEQLLEGTRIAGGFGQALRLFGLANITSDNAGKKIRELNDEIASLQERRAKFAAQGRTGFLPEFDREIADTKKQLEFAKFMQRQAALELGKGITRDETARFGGAGAKRKAPALPDDDKGKATKPKFDAKEVERAEQIMSKFRDKIRGMQDEIARTEGIDSALVSMRRLLEVDKELRDLHSEDKAALLDMAERVDMTKAQVAWQEEMNDALQAGAEAAQAIRNADTEAANSIRDQLDPMRERNRELQRMLDLVNAGKLSMREFNQAAMAPRLRELLKPVVNDFTLLNEALKEGDISLDQYLEAVKRLRGELSETDTMAQGLDHAFQSAFENAIINGEKFRNVIKGLTQDIAKLILRQTVTSPIAAGVSGFIKDVFNFGGARAAGGPVSAGSVFLVGEKGPELFVPSAAGQIIPNGAGGGVTIVQHMTFGSDVSHGTLVQWARRVKQDTITAFVEGRKRNTIPS